MTNEYRVVTADDIEQLVDVEARAFYNTPTPERVELTRRLIPPDWTVARDADITNGDVVAQLFPVATLSLFVNGCGTQVRPRFTLVDASTDVNDTIDYLSD